MLNKILFTTAIAVSAFSGVIATSGLTTFIPGMEPIVYTMGALFEMCMLLTFAWLHNGRKGGFILRSVMWTLAVIVLTLDIIGVAGKFSQGYETRKLGGNATNERLVAEADANIRRAEAVIIDLDKQIAGIDARMEKATDAQAKAKDDRDRIKVAKAMITEAEGRRRDIVKERATALDKLAAAQAAKGDVKGKAIEASGEFAAVQFVGATAGVNPDSVAKGLLWTFAIVLVLFAPALVAAASTHEKAAVQAEQPALKQEEAPVAAQEPVQEPAPVALTPWQKGAITKRLNAEKAKKAEIAAKAKKTKAENKAAKLKTPNVVKFPRAK